MFRFFHGIPSTKVNIQSIAHQSMGFKTIRKNAPTLGGTTVQNAPILHEFTATEIEETLKSTIKLTAPLPFLVTRGESGFLPVYRQLKNGRTRSVTVVRGIKGDIDEFIKYLGNCIPENRIRKKSQSAVQIEGNYLVPMRSILTDLKF
jgi:hypothetical protein